MITSSDGNISASLALCAGNSPVTGEFPSQRPVTRSFDVFFDLHLSKQLWGWWFGTPSSSLRRHCNGKCAPGNQQSPRWHWWLMKQHYAALVYCSQPIGCPGPLFTKRTDVLLQEPVKYRSRKIRVQTFQSLCNLTGTTAAALPRCQSNFWAIRSLKPISRLRDFTRFVGKTSYCSMNKGPASFTIVSPYSIGVISDCHAFQRAFYLHRLHIHNTRLLHLDILRSQSKHSRSVRISRKS